MWPREYGAQKAGTGAWLTHREGCYSVTSPDKALEGPEATELQGSEYECLPCVLAGRGWGVCVCGGARGGQLFIYLSKKRIGERLGEEKCQDPQRDLLSLYSPTGQSASHSGNTLDVITKNTLHDHRAPHRFATSLYQTH